TWASCGTTRRWCASKRRRATPGRRSHPAPPSVSGGWHDRVEGRPGAVAVRAGRLPRPRLADHPPTRAAGRPADRRGRSGAALGDHARLPGRRRGTGDAMTTETLDERAELLRAAGYGEPL